MSPDTRRERDCAAWGAGLTGFLYGLQNFQKLRHDRDDYLNLSRPRAPRSTTATIPIRSCLCDHCVAERRGYAQEKKED